MTSTLMKYILHHVEKHGETNSLDLVNILNEDHQKIIGAIKSLQSLDNVIDAIQVTEKKWEPTAEGKHVIQYGSHEAAVYHAVPKDGIPQKELLKIVPYGKVGFSKALVAGWIKLDKNNGIPIVFQNTSCIEDLIQKHLQNINDLADNLRDEYKKRKLLQEIIIKSFTLRKGQNFVTKIEKQEADLTTDLLINDAWKNKKFKPYNFDAMGLALEVGHLHPLLKVRAEFRKIFLEMGFSEMSTNNFVESSFWNFDALFVPQQHPARDAHDTFFMSDPKYSTKFPDDYLEKVKLVHSKGGYGSQGYQYDWKIEDAQKNVLRTHTTAVSARMLYKLMQQGEFKPVKYFSIDRVFRNETLDATHLAEFHQVEGVIADYNLTLGDLIGTLHEFFRKLGITKLEFKPAYNPYTEPSMEIFCFHEGLGKWIEIGNSGMFRPEMLLPMGLPEKVNVIAWGLSVERPTMIKYKINNIRDLIGPKVDLQMVYDNPICRLEKVLYTSSISKNVSSQPIHSTNTEASYSQPTHLTEKQNYVIFCDPNYPILWLESLLNLASKCFNISVSVHKHSTISRVPKQLENYCRTFQSTANDDVQIVFIWKAMGIHPVMKLNGTIEIFAEINIARFFNRFIESANPSLLKYESKGAVYSQKIDTILDKIHISTHNMDKCNLSNIRQKLQMSGDVFGELSIVNIILENHHLLSMQ